MRNGKQSDTTLARVGSNYLTIEEARENIPVFLYEQDSSKALQSYRDTWVRQQLLLREAEKRDLPQREAIKKRLANARTEVLTRALRDAIINNYTQNVTVSDEELQQYTAQNREQLVLPERYVQFRHLETPSLSSARTARQRLQKGMSWPDVAQQYSLNAQEKIEQANTFWPESAVLKDLPQMRQYVISLDSGAVSPIQRNHSLYHFVQRTDQRGRGEYADPEWFAEELRRWLLIDKQRKHYNSYVKNLYLRAEENNEMDIYNVIESDTLNSQKN